MIEMIWSGRHSGPGVYTTGLMGAWWAAIPLALFGLVLVSSPVYGAQAITPASFALPVAAFPAPRTAVRAHIEPNWRIHRDNVLHFGLSFRQEGRLTGYFMEALEGRRSSPHSDTSYLVSIFPTAQQAVSAFSEQCYYWDALTSHGGSAQETLPDGAYGDPGDQALYSVRLPTGSNFAELLFTRGPTLIEVFQEVDAVQPSRSELRAFFGIGSRLDVTAYREIAATAGE